MYLLKLADEFQFRNSPFVLDMVMASSGLVAITDSGSLSVFNPQSLASGPNMNIKPENSAIKLLCDFRPADLVVCTAAEDGNVCIWDLRRPSSSPAATFSNGRIGIQALACSSASNTIATGMEYEKGEASLLIWDIRSLSAPKRHYSELHSDDITELRFHPTQPTHLLSGSSDGLVNILDTAIADEDQVVCQTFNHNAGIHRAGFLNDTDVFALSHDEKLALYTAAEKVECGAAIQDFGDMRSVLDCQYVANIYPKVTGASFAVGAGAAKQKIFGLVHLAKDGAGKWKLDLENTVGLPGAHDEEIVRSFCFLDDQQIVFTAGEDGCVKSWRPGS